MLKTRDGFHASYPPTSQHLDEWSASFLEWFSSLSPGIVVTSITSPGNGALVGYRATSSSLYGAFVWIGDGLRKFVYIDVSGGRVTTNYDQ